MSKSFQRSNNAKNRNELSDIIPGYTAPMALTSSWSNDNNDCKSGLEKVRRQAMAHEVSKASSKMMTSTQSAQISNFKTGKKRQSPNKSILGKGTWYKDMISTPITDEIKRDINVLQYRNYIDPKKFYKSADKIDIQTTPIQVGTVIEGMDEYYSNRLSKKQRKGTFTEEIISSISKTSTNNNNNAGVLPTNNYVMNKFTDTNRAKSLLYEQRQQKYRQIKKRQLKKKK
jgi:Fcf2 pre-rRNA processing